MAPAGRPDAITPRPGLRWTGLEVHAADGEVVEFTATYDGPSGPGALHEVSRFERRARRWWYVDGDVG